MAKAALADCDDIGSMLSDASERRAGELADRVVLCHETGEPICHAYEDQLAGATREHVREARRQRQRYKRACRAYIPARDDSLATETARILRVKREYAIAQEKRLRAERGIEDQRGMRIVRPDLAQSAKRLKSRERPRSTGRTTTATSAQAARQDGPGGLRMKRASRV